MPKSRTRNSVISQKAKLKEVEIEMVHRMEPEHESINLSLLRFLGKEQSQHKTPYNVVSTDLAARSHVRWQEHIPFSHKVVFQSTWVT